MNRLLLLITGLLLTGFLFAQKVTTITGYAPKYVGKQIDLFQVVDYISLKQERIASTQVGEDSTFTMSFFLKETQKLILTSANNSGFLYASPGATYNVYMPDRNQYDPYRPLGNSVELTFFGLDSTDINYKILLFNRWSDEFLGTYYTKKNAEAGYFVQRLDTFKTNVQNYYKTDTTDAFFASYVRFSMAKIEDMRFLGSRNQYEKYDFYLKYTPVYYQGNAYMEYVSHYYDKLLPRISPEINNKFYLALLKSSPTLIMRALGEEYTLTNNIRLRELVMIKTLGDAFFEKDYPQTNILTVLDSVSKHARFEQNKAIAGNIILRLTELTQGAKAPDFTITSPNGVLDLKHYQGKHLYLVFVSPSAIETTKQVELLTAIYRRYSKEVQFLMVIKKDGSDASVIAALQQSAPWESVVVEENDPVLSTFQVITTPYYVLIDPIGYVVGAPALGPTPNGQYETIDQVFFQVKKAIDEGPKDGR